MDIQEAIRWFSCRQNMGLSDKCQDAENIALAALQEQAERKKGCKVCSKGVDIIYSPADDLYPYGAEFCPHCGRRLK